MSSTIVLHEAFPSRAEAEAARDRLTYHGFAANDIILSAAGGPCELTMRINPHERQRVEQAIRESSLAPVAPRYARRVYEIAPTSNQSLVLLGTVVAVGAALYWTFSGSRQDQKFRGRLPRHREATVAGEHASSDDEKLYDLINDIRICMMTTVDDSGSLSSRPMYVIEADEAGDLWFFTRIESPKATEISRDGHVNLAYAHASKQHYISISGSAEIVRDASQIHEKWSEPLRTWFPEGEDDPQLALIRVRPERGEFWDSPSSTVMHLYGYAKAAITSEPPNELGDNRKVDLG